jgi:glycosyltransferase involved in cell wall biosynthesis
MRIACVVHRFGADIAGGSEGHCRSVAMRLAEHHQVTVLTSTARDHVTWAQSFTAGESTDGPLKVVRFPVARTRSMHRFTLATEVATSGSASAEEQEEWFRENGPEMPALLDHLKQHGRDYDRILFWSFRYYQSFFGLPLVADRAVLVPTAEDDPIIRLDVLDAYFQKPAGFLFLTPEEQSLVGRRTAQPLGPSRVIGTGLDVARPAPPRRVLEPLGVDGTFLLYLGRIDPNKGCDVLIDHYQHWLDNTQQPAPLLMAGPANMPLPGHPMIRCPGYVKDEVREALLAHAATLIVPSPYESLSLVLLEAWNYGTPALVNGRCDVLRGQVQRANGGLYYRNADEFAKGVEWMLTHPDAAKRMGKQGQAYVESEYRWPRVMGEIEELLASV